MLHLHARTSASIGALSLAGLVVIFLTVLPRPAVTATAPSGAHEQLSVRAANPPRFAPTDRDPSVPAASGVSFPTGDADEATIETF